MPGHTATGWRGLLSRGPLQFFRGLLYFSTFFGIRYDYYFFALIYSFRSDCTGRLRHKFNPSSSSCPPCAKGCDSGQADAGTVSESLGETNLSERIVLPNGMVQSGTTGSSAGAIMPAPNSIPAIPDRPDLELRWRRGLPEKSSKPGTGSNLLGCAGPCVRISGKRGCPGLGNTVDTGSPILSCFNSLGVILRAGFCDPNRLTEMCQSRPVGRNQNGQNKRCEVLASLMLAYPETASC